MVTSTAPASSATSASPLAAPPRRLRGAGLRRWRRCSLPAARLRFFGDARRASCPLTQVVELRPAHRTARDDLDAVDAQRVHREGALHPDPVRRLADREGLAARAALAADDRALEDLDALLVALDDAYVHAHGVARLEGGHLLAELLGLDAVDGVHRAGTIPSSGRHAHGQG